MTGTRKDNNNKQQKKFKNGSNKVYERIKKIKYSVRCLCKYNSNENSNNPFHYLLEATL